MHNPRNVILDEPTSGLDVMATRSLRRLILKLKDDGRCVLFSSHIMQEVAALCDDICIIAHGRVAIDDSIEGLLADLGPAGFLGGDPLVLLDGGPLLRRGGREDIEDAFVEAIQMVEPAS